MNRIGDLARKGLAILARVGFRREPVQDRLAIAVLALIPILGFGLPALGGRAFLLGDNLYQNLPLRVFVGRILQEGHLPFWNRATWSGTALLGGFNAGAAYPGTFLFAFLPTLLAWTLNAMWVYLVAGLGMYALLRAHRLAPLAALLGAGAATFAGFMPAQYVHIALVQGMSWTPWVLLGLEWLGTHRTQRAAAWILVCFAGGMVLLAGEPRAVSSVAVIAAIYVAGRLPRVPFRAQLAWATVLAAPVIFALGAAQILPGLPFVAASQRGDVDLGYFAQGPNWEMLPRLFEPFFSTPRGTWNYPYWDTEAWGYVGLLPLVALFTFPFWRKQARGFPATWLAIALVGLLLCLAGLTRLGPWLHQLPLYGGERGQSRNLILVDLGLAGLFACWVDDWLAQPQLPIGRLRSALRLALSLIPPLAVGGLAFGVRFVGPRHWSVFGIPKHAYLVPTALTAATLGALVVLFTRRLPRPAKSAVLAVAVTLDLSAAFWHLDRTRNPVAPLLEASSTSAAIAATLGAYGRFANYDPTIAVKTTLGQQLTPDVSLILDLPSVQGLGSVVDAQYQTETDGHNWRHFSTGALGDETVDELNLKLVLLPIKFAPRRRDPKELTVEQVLVAPHWVEGDKIDAFRTFTNARAKGRAWIEPLEAPDADAPAPPDVMVPGTVTVSHVDDQDGEVDVVSTTGPALLIRSVGYADGWTATLRDAQGVSRVLPVVRHHLVQAIAVPGGEVTVTWSYDPPGGKWGIRLSLAAALGLAALGLGVLMARAFSRRTVQNASPEGAAHAL